MNEKIIKINFMISLFTFVTLCLMSIYFNDALNRNVPNILEFKKITRNGMSFEKVDELKEKYKDITFTGYSEISGEVKSRYGILPSRNINTKVVLTDENYFTLYPYKFIEGGKLDYLSVENGTKVAVISDNLAANFYKSTKVIGNIININDEKYKIVGVYKTNKAFTYSMSEDGYERIVIPYSAYVLSDKKENLLIDVFAAKETAQNTSTKINNKLVETLGSNLYLYNTVNYTLSKKISFQYIRILYFIIGSCAIVFLIKLLIRYFESFIVFFKNSLKTNYFIGVIKENKKEILTFSAKALLCMVCSIIIFNLIKFNIAIKDNYLPSDNIFDLKFYRETILRNMQLINANEAGFSNVYNRYLTNISSIEKIALLGEIMAFIFIVINRRVLINQIIARYKREDN